MLEFFRQIIWRLLIYLRLYPHIIFSFNPFKILEFSEFQKALEISGDEVILDIGCGIGLQTMLIEKRCKKAIGLDISKKAITTAKSISHHMKRKMNSEFYCVRIENAKFENESFDKIISICVLEHISNYDEALREAYRILKKDGQMIFSVDALETIEDQKLLDKHKKQHFVEKYFIKDELEAILERIGFKGIEIYPIFRSNYARKLFIKGINSNFRFGYLSPVFLYFILKYNENKCTDENKGIFLMVKCNK